jgi:hypothetical protein
VVVCVSVLSDDPVTIIFTKAPTMAPTGTPTRTAERIFHDRFSQSVGDKVFIPGSSHDTAAKWMIFDDPMQLGPDAPNLIQRYLMALFYYQTSENGNAPWRSCNPPTGDEDHTCTFNLFTRLVNDTITYVSQPNVNRWLSDTPECQWEGVLCVGGTQVLGVELCKLLCIYFCLTWCRVEWTPLVYVLVTT